MSLQQPSNMIIYPHEHLALDLSGVKGDLDCRLDAKELVIQEFTSLHNKGVSLVADLTNRGMGRNLSYAEDVSLQTGIKILHATGWYKEGFFPEEVYQSDIKKLSAIMRTELESGIENTNVRASVIGEIGTERDKITPEEELIFIAAAGLQSEMGVPIVTHATLGLMGEEQVRLLLSHGARASQILISHVDLTNDLDYILRLIDLGVLVGFDTIGKSAYLDDKYRIKMLKALSAKGVCGSVVLSMDITRRSHLKANGGVGYSYLIDEFIPRLCCDDEYGPAVSPKDIAAMTAENAAHFYGCSNT